MPVKTLDDLIAFNNKEKDTNAKYGQDYLEEAAETETADYDEISKSIEKAASVLDTAFTKHNLDGIAFLNSTASTLPAAAGFPELTIPLGKDKSGVPQGATLTLPAGEDESLLKMGYSLQEHTNGRTNPLTIALSPYGCTFPFFRDIPYNTGSHFICLLLFRQWFFFQPAYGRKPKALLRIRQI